MERRSREGHLIRGRCPQQMGLQLMLVQQAYGYFVLSWIERTSGEIAVGGGRMESTTPPRMPMSRVLPLSTRLWRRVERYALAVAHRARLLQEADRASRDGHRLPHGLVASIRRTPYEVDRYLELARFIDAGQPVFLIDVGGNDGAWAERFLSFFPETQVLAFEPGPFAEEYRARFQANPKVTVVQAAVGDEHGTAEISIAGMLSSFHAYTPDSHMAAELNTMPPVRQMTVPVVRLDDYFDRVTAVRGVVVLKIDTQGHEMPALRGAGRLLERVDIVSVEITLAPEYHDVPPSIGPVVSLMLEWGLLPARFLQIGQISGPYAVEQDAVFTRASRLGRLYGW